MRTVRVRANQIREVLNNQGEITDFDVTLPDEPTHAGGGTPAPVSSGPGIPATNDDGTVGGSFTTEDEAFQQAVKFTKIANGLGDDSSFCSAQPFAAPEGPPFFVTRVNSKGFRLLRCQPAVVAQGAAEDRDRANSAQLEKDLEGDTLGGRSRR